MLARSSTLVPLLTVIASSMLALGCDRAPSADGLTEWRASDHDRAEEPSRIASGQTPAPAAAQSQATGNAQAQAPGNARPANDAAALADLAWNNQCVRCHGVGGRGDGPEGPMYGPPNFTVPAWHDGRTDAQLADSIVKGRGKMPAFGLPATTVQGLVGKVRGFAGR